MPTTLPIRLSDAPPKVLISWPRKTGLILYFILLSMILPAMLLLISATFLAHGRISYESVFNVLESVGESEL